MALEALEAPLLQGDQRSRPRSSRLHGSIQTPWYRIRAAIKCRWQSRQGREEAHRIDKGFRDPGRTACRSRPHLRQHRKEVSSAALAGQTFRHLKTLPRAHLWSAPSASHCAGAQSPRRCPPRCAGCAAHSSLAPEGGSTEGLGAVRGPGGLGYASASEGKARAVHVVWGSRGWLCCTLGSVCLKPPATCLVWLLLSRVQTLQEAAGSHASSASCESAGTGCERPCAGPDHCTQLHQHSLMEVTPPVETACIAGPDVSQTTPRDNAYIWCYQLLAASPKTLELLSCSKLWKVLSAAHDTGCPPYAHLKCRHNSMAKHCHYAPPLAPTSQ